MSYSTIFLGELVEVKVDRPLGSKHPKYGFDYPLNYGYIEDVKSPDGEGLDAYILGINKPLRQFMGICIAVIHRLNDADDKLVVVSRKVNVSNEEIRKLTYFQEKLFESEIIR